MARRTDFTKAITYRGQDLIGPIDLTYKIDGCRVLWRDGRFISRNDKRYPGLRKACTQAALDVITMEKDCEIFVKDFATTTGILQRHDPMPNSIDSCHVYPLNRYDMRLHARTIEDPDFEDIKEYLDIALSLGHEGLVLRSHESRGLWYRVKPTCTADVVITGWFEQHDKDGNPKDVLGGFDTAYGAVTAFTMQMRQALWQSPQQYVGQLMEVSYKELYPSGNFRFGVKFERFRPDKDEESFDTRTLPALRS